MTGHKKQQIFFRQAFKSEQLSHAYMLTGQEGIGKKIFAKAFAKGLLCPHERFFEQCDCPSCKQAENGSHPDFHVYEEKDGKWEEKSNLKIEGIRQISENAAMSAKGWRIFIIDNVHILCLADAGAASALLKTIEEPGINTVFLLITHRPDKVLSTIQSRCVNVFFDPLHDSELASVLKSKRVEPDFPLPYAAGSVSTALTLLDIDVQGLLSSLNYKNFDKLGMQILAMSDKNKFTAAVSVIQSWFLSIYKRTLNPEIAVFLQYTGAVLKNLTYNVNMQLLLLDFYIKLTNSLALAEAEK
ncbi:MAG: DNA polymerase III subunit delta' [Deferribacteraceae bacterium]|nr:DNA polymerase III subunit delta' [Deferribacteraceae bacterium]